jgi:hypothetical protein
MSIKSSLGKLPRTGRPRKETVKSMIPVTIHLPDGREYTVKDILTKPRDRRSYNLQTGMEFGPRTKRKIAKGVDTETKE